jgi:hypothetical protein
LANGDWTIRPSNARRTGHESAFRAHSSMRPAGATIPKLAGPAPSRRRHVVAAVRSCPTCPCGSLVRMGISKSNPGSVRTGGRALSGSRSF